MNILVVAAHPDDEVLGCGATIAQHISKGDRVEVLILAEGITSRTAERSPLKHQKQLASLSIAAHKANKILGVKRLHLHGFPDNRMDSVARLDIVKIVEQTLVRLKPAIVYTHHAGDVNIDHRRAFEAVMTACRPLPGNSVKKILCFETVSSTEWQLSPSNAFIPNWYVDVTRTLPKKMKALKAYVSEMRPWPHARSFKAIEHLARWRGASVGVPAAESFMLVRRIVR